WGFFAVVAEAAMVCGGGGNGRMGGGRSGNGGDGGVERKDGRWAWAQAVWVEGGREGLSEGYEKVQLSSAHCKKQVQRSKNRVSTAKSILFSLITACFNLTTEPIYKNGLIPKHEPYRHRQSHRPFQLLDNRHVSSHPIPHHHFPADIRKSRFETEYSKLVAKAIDDDDGEDHDVLCEWIVDPCLSYFRESTVNVTKEITFEDFYYPPTHHLKLLVSGDSLYPKETRDRGTINALKLMIPSGDLPSCSEVPREKAPDLRIVSDAEWDDYMSEIPQKGIIADGTTKFFKPALDKKQLLREVDMHLRIRRAGLQNTLKIPNLHSIVVSTDTKMTIGLLFDLIPSTDSSLYSHQNSALASEHHVRWKQQVTETVMQLHAHDLVWGDVHPGNIVIDTSFNAWVVDFGGGSIVEFVPRKKAGTKEGDWLGVGKIFDEWIFKSDD
ncbi:hypothetical protein V501_09315, partial [Pseudogymnoascus sp. VKM F-4519 (FW-2642)]